MRNSCPAPGKLSARCLLGECLIGQAKYADAEPLLLSGYEGLIQLAHGFQASRNGDIKRALRSLSQLYEATGESRKTEQWKEKLADIKNTESPTSDVSATSDLREALTKPSNGTADKKD